jgi:hypothetical protein
LDVFESWEQFCRVKITGYTLRDGTDVCRFNFPTGKPNHRTTDHMTLLINQGWQITAIHYENVEWWHRRGKHQIQPWARSPVATHGLFA